MRAAPAVLLGLLGLSAGSALWADVSSARTLITHCVQTAEPGVRGVEALREACPGIELALIELDIQPFLPADWRTQLSPRALDDFAALQVRYADPASWESVRPDARSLRSIALNLQPPPVPASSWDRLKAWFRHWLQPGTGAQPSWLRFFPSLQLGPRTVRVMFVALAVLVVAAAAAVVALEIRAARSPAGRRLRLRPGRSSADVASTPGVPPGGASLANLDSAPARDRPVLLLRALVQALTGTQRLHRDRELTCRELIVQARFDTARQREDFEHVALLAERALYGGPQAAPPAIPEDVLRGARALHDQLLAARRSAAGAG